MRKIFTLLISLVMFPYMVLGGNNAQNNMSETDGGMTEVTIDVSSENTTNDNYKIENGSISILKKNVVYVLTGTTDKTIKIEGNDESDDEWYHLKLNGVTLNGNFIIHNDENEYINIKIEVPENTDNTFGIINSTRLEISGAGTLNATGIIINQNVANSLKIKDTKIIVNNATGYSCDLEGEIILEGEADVTINGNGQFPVLKVGQKENVEASMTLQDNAQLKCLQDPDYTTSSGYLQGGMYFFNGATLLIEDNSYLQAKAYEQNGAAIDAYMGGNVTIQDNATLELEAPSVALSCSKDINIQGGTLNLVSQNSNAIYTTGSVNISGEGTVVNANTSSHQTIWTGGDLVINGGAEVDLESSNSNAIYTTGSVNISGEGTVVNATSYYPTIWSENNFTISGGANVTAVSSNDIPLYSNSGSVSIENAIVDVTSPSNIDAIKGNSGTSISGTRVETNDGGKINSGATIINSLVFSGGEGKVSGNYTLLCDEEISEGEKISVPKGASITVPDGKNITNDGEIALEGTIILGNKSAGELKSGIDTEKMNLGKITGKNGTLEVYETMTVILSNDSEISKLIVAEGKTLTIEGKLTVDEISGDVEGYIEAAEGTPIVFNSTTTGGSYKVIAFGEEIQSNTKLPDGTVITISVTPNDGYEIESVKVGGNDASKTELRSTSVNYYYEIKGDETNLNIEVTFESTTPPVVVTYHDLYITESVGAKLVSRNDKDRTPDGGSFTLSLEKEEGYEDCEPTVYYKRGRFGEWKELKLDEVSGYYQIRSVYTDIYVKVSGDGIWPVSNEKVEAQEVKVYTQNGAIVVSTPSLMDIQIISMTGAQVAADKVAGQREFRNLAEGIYVVRVGEEIVKVRL